MKEKVVYKVRLIDQNKYYDKSGKTSWVSPGWVLNVVENLIYRYGYKKNAIEVHKFSSVTAYSYDEFLSEHTLTKKKHGK